MISALMHTFAVRGGGPPILFYTVLYIEFTVHNMHSFSKNSSFLHKKSYNMVA